MAEILPQKASASASSACAAFNWACVFIISYIFPYMQKALGEWVFLVFAGILAILCITTAIFLPESKGKHPEEVMQLLKAR